MATNIVNTLKAGWPTMTELYARLETKTVDQTDKIAATATRQTEVHGWNFTPDAGLGRLVRARDGADLTAASDERLWPKQILDFEHHEGEQWPPEQIVAMLSKPFTEVLVTPEMTGAAAQVEWPCVDWLKPAFFTHVFRAMHAVAPVPLVTEAEDALHYAKSEALRLRSERDRALSECSRATNLWSEVRGVLRNLVTRGRIGQNLLTDLGFKVGDLKEPLWQYDVFNDEWVCGEYLQNYVRNMPDPASVKEMLDGKDTEIALLRQALAAKDARIAELKSVLASTPVAFGDPDAKPTPAPGFLRAIRQGNKATVGLVTGRGDMPAGTNG